MHIQRPRPPHPRRSGLAPLELVLSLPILLIVMSLMVLAGWMGMWKVRAQVHARQAAWRAISPRTGAGDPNPAGWPTPATMQVERGTPILAGSPPGLSAYDAHRVVRGPSLGPLRVNTRTLDLAEGTRRGRAEVERGFIVMGAMPPGRFDYSVPYPLHDDRRQFWQMPRVGSNRSRRIPEIYPAVGDDWQGRLPAQVQRSRMAITALRNNAGQVALSPLDRDEELRAYYGRFRDYHPRIDSSRYCTVDENVLRNQIVTPLIERIRGRQPRGDLGDAGVPGALTRDFLRMYRDLRPLHPEVQPYIEQLEGFESVLVN